MSNTITLDKLKRINQLGDRARHLATIINLADSSAELEDSLRHLGFKLWEYNCQGDDIYKDGKHAYDGSSVCRMFTRWVRCDSRLHVVDEIDTTEGTVRCHDTNQPWCDAIELVHYQARSILASAGWQSRAKLDK